MDDPYDESFLSDVLPFLDSFEDNQLDKRPLEPEWDDFEIKRFHSEDNTTTTPDPKHVEFKETTPSKLLSLSGPAGNPESSRSNEDKFDQQQEGIIDIFNPQFWTSALNSIDCSDVDISKYHDYDKSKSVGAFLTEKFNIEKIIQNKNEQVFKLDCLIVMIDSLILVEPNILIVLRDETGKITGIMYKEDIDIYRNELVPGCVMILVEATVYSPIGCDPYVIISKDSLSRIVPSYTIHYDDFK
ncbi:hypothetical protein MACK_003735 [Theileria orientalis]|uniref:Homologous recombination OB-fold protein OB-fold domain-containing protein n=1 Tax=Theileria orientalis TaxID=68886 RepID=A0A976SIT6_THEOR|nr:hypothetical protein MACK_003735 [Theileria orientalis]